VHVEKRVEPLKPTPPGADAEGVYVDVSGERALVWIGHYGRIEAERTGSRCRFITPVAVDDDELAHPYLGLAATYFSAWRGRLTFHAGAVVVGGRVWALLGEKESGKSTTLALLHGLGHEVVTDDILVVEDGRCLAGSRCVDLRADAAARLGRGLELRPARFGDRHRLRLRPLRGRELRLAGWVFLHWGPGPALTPVPGLERLGRLHHSRIVRSSADSPVVLLDLAALPAFDFRRPPNWDASAAAEALVAALAAVPLQP
jgi:hypothetical protein